MRTMQHNSRANAGGRVHGTKHNDRNFDVEKADNIDIERSAGNVYWNVYNDPTMTFEQAELRFYEEKLGLAARFRNTQACAERLLDLLEDAKVNDELRNAAQELAAAVRAEAE